MLNKTKTGYTHLSSPNSTEKIAVRVAKGSPGLGTPFRVLYAAHCSKDLIFVAVPIEPKYLVSSSVI